MLFNVNETHIFKNQEYTGEETKAPTHAHRCVGQPGSKPSEEILNLKHLELQECLQRQQGRETVHPPAKLFFSTFCLPTPDPPLPLL